MYVRQQAITALVYVATAVCAVAVQQDSKDWMRGYVGCLLLMLLSSIRSEKVTPHMLGAHFLATLPPIVAVVLMLAIGARDEVREVAVSVGLLTCSAITNRVLWVMFGATGEMPRISENRAENDHAAYDGITRIYVIFMFFNTWFMRALTCVFVTTTWYALARMPKGTGAQRGRSSVGPLLLALGTVLAHAFDASPFTAYLLATAIGQYLFFLLSSKWLGFESAEVSLLQPVDNVDEENPIDDCAVCCDAPTDPVRTVCGHTFCRACITTWLSDYGHDTCPVCREAM